MWLKRSTCMNSVTSTRARRADLQEVVAGEVDEHEVLGSLLGVGEQLLGEFEITFGVTPRGREPAIGCMCTRFWLTLTSASGLAPTMEYGSPIHVDELRADTCTATG